MVNEMKIESKNEDKNEDKNENKIEVKEGRLVKEVDVTLRLRVVLDVDSDRQIIDSLDGKYGSYRQASAAIMLMQEKITHPMNETDFLGNIGAFGTVVKLYKR